ncbi:MAG: RnfABCDGE type electron transport complex subunit B, partial [Clostridia bacterium]|nr:RnfABCDGE type electron transport complex subunit B [Clostridia bacterium]
MNTSAIITAIIVLAVIALIIGIILSVAEKAFKVEVDEKEVAVRAELPGSNCGGCGYAGCDALAAAIAKGEAPVSACPVGGMPVAQKIAEIMGEEVGEMEKMVAYVKCDGTCEKRTTDYNYYGIDTCLYASKMPGSSPYACKYGCLG